MSWPAIRRDLILAALLAAFLSAATLLIVWPMTGRNFAFGLTSILVLLAPHLPLYAMGVNCDYDRYAIKTLIYIGVATPFALLLSAFSSFPGLIILLVLTFIMVLYSLTLGWAGVVVFRRMYMGS